MVDGGGVSVRAWFDWGWKRGEQGAGEAKCGGCERSQRFRWWLAWRWGRNLWRELARRGQIVSVASAKAELRMMSAAAKARDEPHTATTTHEQCGSHVGNEQCGSGRCALSA